MIFLSLVPAVAGSARLVEIGTGAEITPQNERFLAMPLPVVVHIVSVTIYCILGAFQFMPSFRRRRPSWHRAAGRVLVTLGLAAALSGLWMTLFYPWVNFDGVVVYVVRLLVGSAMFGFLCTAFLAIRRRDVPRHRAFMIRAYALGIGAGTQVFTHIPYFLLPSMQGEAGRAVCMVGAWVLNAVVAEWIIRRSQVPRVSPAVAKAA